MSWAQEVVGRRRSCGRSRCVCRAEGCRRPGLARARLFDGWTVRDRRPASVRGRCPGLGRYRVDKLFELLREGVTSGKTRDRRTVSGLPRGSCFWTTTAASSPNRPLRDGRARRGPSAYGGRREVARDLLRGHRRAACRHFERALRNRFVPPDPQPRERRRVPRRRSRLSHGAGSVSRPGSRIYRRIGRGPGCLWSRRRTGLLSTRACGSGRSCRSDTGVGASAGSRRSPRAARLNCFRRPVPAPPRLSESEEIRRRPLRCALRRSLRRHRSLPERPFVGARRHRALAAQIRLIFLCISLRRAAAPWPMSTGGRAPGRRARSAQSADRAPSRSSRRTPTPGLAAILLLADAGDLAAAPVSCARRALAPPDGAALGRLSFERRHLQSTFDRLDRRAQAGGSPGCFSPRTSKWTKTSSGSRSAVRPPMSFPAGRGLLIRNGRHRWCRAPH